MFLYNRKLLVVLIHRSSYKNVIPVKVARPFPLETLDDGQLMRDSEGSSGRGRPKPTRAMIRPHRPLESTVLRTINDEAANKLEVAIHLVLHSI